MVSTTPVTGNFFRTHDNKKRGKYSKSAIITNLEFHLSFFILIYFYTTYLFYKCCIYSERKCFAAPTADASLL